MKRRIYALLTTLALSLSAMPQAGVSAAADVQDYYPRNFMATDNHVFWEGCAQISWFNPAEKPEKIELYSNSPAQAAGEYVLVGDDYDTTANASVVTTLPTKNWKNFPRPNWYTFKLVSTFADGKTTEQLIDYYVPIDTSYDGKWSVTKDVSDDFKTVVQRGGWCYSQTNQNYDIFPMGTALVYENGNPALKVWSNAHVSDHVDEVRDGKTNNSGNYFGNLNLKTVLQSGVVYDISFRYKTKGIENLALQVNNKEVNTALANTDGEWVDFSRTFTSRGGNLLSFEFKLGNEELLLDDIVVKKQGTDENLVSDGDFSKLSASAPKDVTKALKAAKDGKINLTWIDSADSVGANVYKIENGTEIKKAFVRKDKQSVSFEGSEKDQYIVKAVNARGAEAEGSECMIPTYSGYEIAATELMAMPSGKAGDILVTWRNANCPTITGISLKDKDGNVIASSADGNFSTAPNALCTYTVSGLENYSYENYTLSTETKYGSIEQQIAGTAIPMTDSSYICNIPLTDKMTVRLTALDINKALVQARASIVNDGGSKAVKIMNSIEQRIGSVWLEINAPDDSMELKASTKYRLELRYKGSGYAWQKIYVHDQGSDLGGVDLFTGSKETIPEWRNFSKEFKTDNSNGGQGIRIMMEGVTDGPLWIDDIKLTEVETGDVIFTENFENPAGKCDVEIINLIAEPKDSAVKLLWSAPGMEDESAKIIRIYAETAEGKYLAATVSPFDSEIEIKGLENEEEYTFTFDAIDINGYTSDTYEVKAMPHAADYKVTDVTLLDKNNNAADKLAAGDYTVSAKVKNNGMGSAFTAQVIVCLYDGDMLYDAKSSPVTKIAETDWRKNPTEIVTDKITVPSGENFTLKAYIWDSIKGMTKLADTSEYK